MVEPNEELTTTITVPGKLSTTGLRLPDGLEYETWSRIGLALTKVEVGMSWAIGDWLCYGENNFGEKYVQAASATELTPDTLKTYNYISKAFPPHKRHAMLTWRHHQIVVSLEDEEREKWLTLAETKGWNTSELRGHLAGRKEKDATTDGQPKKYEIVLSYQKKPKPESIEALERYCKRYAATVKKVVGM